jgi:hypothetical protein
MKAIPLDIIASLNFRILCHKKIYNKMNYELEINFNGNVIYSVVTQEDLCEM